MAARRKSTGYCPNCENWVEVAWVHDDTPACADCGSTDVTNVQ